MNPDSETQTPQGPLFLTIVEAAQRLNVTPRTIEQMVYRGDIPSAKVGKERRIPQEAIYEFVKRAYDEAREMRERYVQRNAQKSA